MINLIPKEEKKRMKKDFYHRLVLLFLLVLNFSVFIFSVSLLPSLFISVEKNNSIKLKLASQKNEPIPVIGEQSLNTIKSINSKLDLVEKAEKEKFAVSLKVINAILLRKRSDIRIVQILYENDPVKGKKINLTGTAPSRAVLLLFRQSLEESPNFKNVNLPISNFIKGSNIQFYLSLTPA